MCFADIKTHKFTQKTVKVKAEAILTASNRDAKPSLAITLTLTLTQTLTRGHMSMHNIGTCTQIWTILSTGTN